MDVSDLTSFIIAGAGILGTYVSWRLGQRGQKNDERQQSAATSLQKRITAFDELESLNDRLSAEIVRLNTEVARLQGLIAEAETRGDIRLAKQASRCRERLEDMSATMVVMQSVVLSEVTRTAAQNQLDLTAQHIADEHPDEAPDLS